MCSPNPFAYDVTRGTTSIKLSSNKSTTNRHLNYPTHTPKLLTAMLIPLARIQDNIQRGIVRGKVGGAQGSHDQSASQSVFLRRRRSTLGSAGRARWEKGRGRRVVLSRSRPAWFYGLKSERAKNLRRMRGCQVLRTRTLGRLSALVQGRFSSDRCGKLRTCRIFCAQTGPQVEGVRRVILLFVC